MNKEIKVSFEYIKENCETIGDLKELYSNIKKFKEMKGGKKKNGNSNGRF